jgi:hypothetical protein
LTIKRMEAQIARLQGKIERREAELSDLKSRRKDLKARLADAKKAAKEGRPLPDAAQPEGLAERIGTVLTEKVIDPLTGLLHPTTEKPKPEAPGPAR